MMDATDKALQLAERISDVQCSTREDAIAVAAAADMLCELHAKAQELERAAAHAEMAAETEARYADERCAKAAADEREACAATVEQMTARSRWIRGGINGEAAKPCEFAAAIRARGADLDLARLTARGATAWAGVDAQALREGRMPPND